ncbi:hypothetical protein WJX75_006745 [Coccomyxa subellipsoidea]|uniref:Thg1 C-terminal domain-containing protein n=1 Tax=Coccomyxa subellipsoidea TaxID=248742 RepID=A0ABR2YN78_9CHLO
MNRCAVEVLQVFTDIRIAYGESDEYSFVFSKASKLYGRRSSKLVSLVTSCFTGNYADTHINNQYNTCFWALVHSGKSRTEAQDQLKGTQTDYKNELLFTEFGINYASLPVMFRKGSVVIRSKEQKTKKHARDGTPVLREVSEVVVIHDDIIGNSFWKGHPDLLAR